MVAQDARDYARVHQILHPMPAAQWERETKTEEPNVHDRNVSTLELRLSTHQVRQIQVFAEGARRSAALPMLAATAEAVADFIESIISRYGKFMQARVDG